MVDRGFYYAKYVSEITNVMCLLDDNEAISIRNVKNVLLKTNLSTDLKYRLKIENIEKIKIIYLKAMNVYSDIILQQEEFVKDDVNASCSQQHDTEILTCHPPIITR